MRIYKDGKGKHIVDLEKETIKVDIDCEIKEIFSSSTVSLIENGKWTGRTPSDNTFNNNSNKAKEPIGNRFDILDL